jgi:hypothetical protein
MAWFLLSAALIAGSLLTGCGGSAGSNGPVPGGLISPNQATQPAATADSTDARTRVPTPAPSAKATTDVVLLYRGVTNSTSWYFQGSTNGTTTCNNTSYVPGTFTSTPVIVGGPLTAGDLVGIVATLDNWQNVVVAPGTCPDHMAGVTEIVDLTRPAPSPSVTPSGKPSPSPSPSPSPTGAPTVTPMPGGGSAANYTEIVNGQAWPTSFRPYCVNVTKNPAAPCPFNNTLPDSGATLATGSSQIISAINAAGDLELGFWRGEDSGGFPVYTAKSTDPMVTVTCTRYCQSSSVAINIPSKARPEAGICPGDCQMAVIEANGTEYALYGQSPAYGGGSTLSVVGLAWSSVTGMGVDPNYMSLAMPGRGGGDVANGTMMAMMSEPTVAEISSGAIFHAININVPCESGQVFPGSNAEDCASNFGYAGPAAGARFQLVLTANQINGLASNSIGYVSANAAPWEKTILLAMHNYGAYATVTCGRACGDRMNIYMENGTQYSAFGGTWPVSTFNWSSSGNNGGVGTVPTNWRPGGINWAIALQIVSSCYALEQC